ncbi:MAG: Uma2 family endonuclease [Eubacteriales bacterium]|nr:Uma2 family endonuclease [Eubacteriales bacterium]
MPLRQKEYYKTEKINDTIYNMSPSGGFRHSQVNGNIYFALMKQLKNSICTASVENLDLYLSDDEYVIPDIMLICDRNKIKKDKYRGVPSFIVETLSPATSFKDKTVKKEKYAQLGVAEYWIVSPGEKSVEVYHLNNGTYELVASHILVEDIEDENYNAETVLTLKAVPAVSIVLKEVFENID